MPPGALSATGAPRSALYVGHVRHRRRRPARNAFRHGVYHVLIDVDELPRLDREIAGFGYRRAALTAFHDVDHLGTADVPVRTKLARWLADQGVELPLGRLEVLTNLRVLGHVFNPVSWWFAYDGDDRLALVVAEVDNTFGESHGYVLDRLDVGPDGLVRADADKVFHVSPFLGIAGHGYRFTFCPPSTERGSRVLCHMDVADPDGKLFDATQDERRVALTSRNLRLALWRYPLVTLRTVALIQLQALRLWRRRVPLVRRPTAPDDGYGDLARPRPEVARPSSDGDRPAIPGAVDAEPDPSPNRSRV